MLNGPTVSVNSVLIFAYGPELLFFRSILAEMKEVLRGFDPGTRSGDDQFPGDLV
jgi:hypothetical protein